ALGNCMPVAACLAREDVAAMTTPGTQGPTFGGNPLACRAALTVLDIMREDGIGERAASAGQRLIDRLRAGLEGLAPVKAVRGRGLMVGIELDRDCGELKDDALADGVIINVTRGRTVRLLPPLIVMDAEVTYND